MHKTYGLPLRDEFGGEVSNFAQKCLIGIR